MEGEVEEVVDEEDYNYSVALYDNETAMNENDSLRIPESRRYNRWTRSYMSAQNALPGMFGWE